MILYTDFVFAGKGKSMAEEQTETNQAEVPPPKAATVHCAFQTVVQTENGTQHVVHTESGTQQEQEHNIHPHVTCDGCNTTLKGNRYKCLICPDFDLCERCEGEQKHNEHPMIRIANANDKSWRVSGNLHSA